MTDSLDQLWPLALALGIGFLIGLERGFVLRGEATGQRFAGIRTFSLVGLLGGLSALLYDYAGPWMPMLILFSVSSFAVAGFTLLVLKKDLFATTTGVALLLTFVLGFLAVSGFAEIAAAAAVVTAVVLSMRDRLHNLLQKLAVVELQGLLQLLLISVVLLPLLPNEGMGPGGVLNPVEIWWMAILVAGLSFLGYAAVRLAGTGAGLLLTGFFGGLASSTAVTVTVSRLSKRFGGEAANYLAAAASLAALLMFIRIMLLSSTINAELGWHLAPVIGTMALVTALGAAALLYFGRGRTDASKPAHDLIHNPVDLPVAFGFAAALALVILLAHYLEQWAGAYGLYALAAISGLTDVDAITLTMARMARDGGDPDVAARAVVIAALVNTVVKLGIAGVIAGPVLTKRLALVLGPALIVGAAAWFMVI